MAKLLPAGCDQQGRCATRQWHDTMPVQPQAAEAATEIGADDTARPPATRWGLLLVLLGWPVVFVIGGALVAIFA